MRRIALFITALLCWCGEVRARGGGGCFVAGTKVAVPGGSVAIEQLKPGDRIVAFDADGALRISNVEELAELEAGETLALTAGAARVQVTPEHPFLTGSTEFERAGNLLPGGSVFVMEAGRLTRRAVESCEVLSGQVSVYNLRTSAPNTFIAGGFAVHNKGGGGGGGGSHGGSHSSHSSSHSSHSSGGISFRSSSGGNRGSDGGASSVAGIFVIVVILIIVVSIALRRSGSGSLDLDYSFQRGEIEAKAQKTRKLLEFLARVDGDMDPEKLTGMARDVFLQLQGCWQAREYDAMRPRLMPDLYNEHLQQIEGMKQNHEINVIDQLSITAVDIVNVRYPHEEEQREFTALITATATDYYIDEQTRNFVRGDRAAATFQEFWTFQRQQGGWLLREIEQTRESDALTDENYFEQFTDKGVEQIYGGEADRSGPAGPWLEASTLSKASRIERLLNFLVKTDPLWNRGAMILRAREVFTRVFLAREAGNPEQISENDLLPDAAAALRAEVDAKKAAGTMLEFRNFCVRKVELVHVHNTPGRTGDNFTVRISAHAQRIVRARGQRVSADADVRRFVEYWTFGRDGNAWKLSEILPPAHGDDVAGRENIDEESSPEQLQWFYRQTRAM